MNEKAVKFYKGQKVQSGSQTGIVLRYFGDKAVQVMTMREKLILSGFPAKPVGTEWQSVKETWPGARVTAWTPISQTEAA